MRSVDYYDDERGEIADIIRNVDQPQHYTSHPARCTNCGTGVECIQIAEHMGFNLGNAIKYLWRADEKGRPLEDLRKAVWYVQREIEKRERS